MIHLGEKRSGRKGDFLASAVFNMSFSSKIFRVSRCCTLGVLSSDKIHVDPAFSKHIGYQESRQNPIKTGIERIAREWSSVAMKVSILRHLPVR
jgi:hypothetical protein